MSTAKYNLAVAGSFIAIEDGKYFNRAFFITPEGDEYYYDKRHLFRMAAEDKHFTAGDKRTVIKYKDWNVCLQVCYDLRFPVWSRNVDNEYDLLIYVANWPEPRKRYGKHYCLPEPLKIWRMCGVNRVGIDGKGFTYRGDSMIFSLERKKLADAGKREEITRTCTLNKSDLRNCVLNSRHGRMQMLFDSLSIELLKKRAAIGKKPGSRSFMEIRRGCELFW